VVAAASYEARTFGVRSAIPMSRAVRLCPSLVIVHPDFQKYRAVSQQVFAIYRSVTSLVEPLSLDEAYLDVTENNWGEALGMNVAKRIKQEIRAATGLTASAGVAPNKFLAKIASGWQKPDGLTVVAPERVEHFLQGLPVDALWGVGPVTARKLRAHGIEKLVDVRSADLEGLRSIVGSLAEWLKQLAQGIDDRPVVADYEVKSSGSENTFATDLRDIAEIREEIESMARGTARWLAKRDLYARTVTIKVRYNDFTTITRSHTEPACRDEDAIVRRADRTARENRGRPATDSAARCQRAQSERDNRSLSLKDLLDCHSRTEWTLAPGLPRACAAKPAACHFADLAHFLPYDSRRRQDNTLRKTVAAADLHVGIRDVHHLNHHLVIRA
jgi:DNA polymerase-4